MATPIQEKHEWFFYRLGNWRVQVHIREQTNAINFPSALNTRISEVERTITCAQQYYNISCPIGSQLKLPVLRWGRTADESICPHWASRLANCLSTTADTQIRNLCENTPVCYLKLNYLLGDPCPNIHKYLNATHTCLEPANCNDQCYNAVTEPGPNCTDFA
ncbi:hypothetical protein CAPTEDRAFT_216032 [Capitella teleta]|uniref:SUEL-type lectin domain-containing protein n=1 Tax=Capitella teleta TaxID=283909 RepID=R7TYJ6_CAPTE|nr:hypothetical protein CAPTEDRAFT_216032 [Capitella teleta]|eukprot:ELT96501.1 hypothetical protein CAPTEDRAFT_216032 [Capitella teleta]